MTTDATVAILPAPNERLDPRVRTAWRLAALFSGVIEVAVALVAAYLLTRWGVSPVLSALVVVTVPVWVAVRIFVVPGLQYRHWRYELRDEEIDLQHGIVTITRTLIPMMRIQHVDTRRGPLDRWFGLASVVVYTAAGASTIPGLAVETAGRLRDRIAALANMRDEI